MFNGCIHYFLVVLMLCVTIFMVITIMCGTLLLIRAMIAEGNQYIKNLK
jgi:hypothetical protein